ncbi:PTS sugar transporter subunit IIA [Enterococcus sp. DIV1298c]|uniref:PTS sugar transporter subunit IIA n=1 Tax=Enterococcus sp. DIV1298c TaxID=2815328 RepID=UPI001A933F56|nr:PTS sugar transporter subunit IIA [Enterococcus sp. DIV1298c]MBO0461984.1 PTS sugar transporter subunit IIA [Enterococcus sp. DIV1298c]
MSIATLLPSNHIFLDMESTNKEAYIQSVLEREQHSTTGIGNNIAIPHGKSEAVIEPSIVFARLKQPIDWQSLDEEPVSVVILLAIPESQKGDTHLRILSEIAMKLMDDEITAQLKTETNKEQIAKLLSE